MKIKTYQLHKGFTLIELLLVLTLISILITIGAINFNTTERFSEARNDVRQRHVQLLENTILQYKLQEGSYPPGLTREYKEICNTGALTINDNLPDNYCADKLDLRVLVPKYIQSIPLDPSYNDSSNGSGYNLAIDEASNTAGIKSIQTELDKTIAVNETLPNQESSVVNDSLNPTNPQTPPEAPTIINNGLALYLDAGNTLSYSGTGSIWTDLSGNSNNATLFNGVTYSTDNGGTFVFDGTNDYITIPHSDSLNFPSQLTMSIWYYSGTNIGNSATLNTLYLKGRTDLDRYNPLLSVDSTYRWGLSGGGGSRSQYNSESGFIQPNTWYNISVSHISGSDPKVYKNNILSTTHTYDPSRGTGSVPLVVNTDPVSINADILRNTIGNFNGKISIFMIYNRALTQEEIAHNFEFLRSRFGI